MRPTASLCPLLVAVLALVPLAAPAPQTTPVHFVVAERGTPFHGDSYVLPISDPAQLREARDVLRGLNGFETICVARIADGADGVNRDVRAAGEPLWTWHVIDFLGFAETTAEVLDGWPGLVESSKGAYIRFPPDGDGTGSIGFWAYSVVEELGPGPGIPPPTAPTGPSLTNLGGGGVRVTWSDRSSNEEGFEVQRQKKVGSLWTATTLIALGPNATSHTDGPGPGTFQYRVRAWNAAGSSTWTGWKSIKIR
ncbi:MAG TPA: fibronectin type III domain-containing protein [Planctomycetota bacterium]